MKNHLIYLAFGNDVFIREAAYSILSFIAIHGTEHSVNIIIVTDRIDAAKKHLGNMEGINYVEISDAQIKEWRGPNNYLYRIKPECLKHVSNLYGGDVTDIFCLLDTDTVWSRNIAPCLAMARIGNTIFMDASEGKLRIVKHMFRDRRTLHSLANRQWTINGKNFIISGEMELWNSGAIMLQRKHMHYIDETIAVIDALWKYATITTLEQNALSIVAHNNQVQVNPLNGTIFHYHEYKEFRHELRAFFSHYQGAPAHVLAQHTLRLHPQIRMQPKIAFYQLPRWRRSLFQKFGKTWTPLPLPWESQAPPRQC